MNERERERERVEMRETWAEETRAISGRGDTRVALSILDALVCVCVCVCVGLCVETQKDSARARTRTHACWLVHVRGWVEF
jgi:hypothetical protein